MLVLVKHMYHRLCVTYINILRHTCVTCGMYICVPKNTYVCHKYTYMLVKHMLVLVKHTYHSLFVTYINILRHTCVTSVQRICVPKDTYVWHDFRRYPCSRVAQIKIYWHTCVSCILNICVVLDTHVCQNAHISKTSMCVFWSNICIQHIQIFTHPCATRMNIRWHTCVTLMATICTSMCVFCTYIRDKHMYFSDTYVC